RAHARADARGLAGNPGAGTGRIPDLAPMARLRAFVHAARVPAGAPAGRGRTRAAAPHGATPARLRTRLDRDLLRLPVRAVRGECVPGRPAAVDPRPGRARRGDARGALPRRHLVGP